MERAAQQLERRGIYWAKHRIDGYPVLYAVKSNGDRLPKVVVLRPGRTALQAAAWLQAKLDLEDPPRPRLTLVTDDADLAGTAGPAPAVFRHPGLPDGIGGGEDALTYDLKRWARNPARWPRYR